MLHLNICTFGLHISEKICTPLKRHVFSQHCGAPFQIEYRKNKKKIVNDVAKSLMTCAMTFSKCSLKRIRTHVTVDSTY